MAMIVNGKGFVGIRRGTAVNPPSIVTDGLKLYLDAGQTSSYPGTGTVWTDISGNGNNGTLINGGSGLSYNSANGGYLQFDGLNDYVSTNYIPNSNSFTYCVWGKSSSSGGSNRIIGNASSNLGTSGACIIWSFNTNRILNVRRGTLNGDIYTPVINNFSGNWHYIVLTYNSSTGSILYCDNIQVGSNTNIGFVSTLPFRIGRDGDGADAFNGYVSNVQVYNKALSATEVSQNYNALKSRFGL